MMALSRLENLLKGLKAPPSPSSVFERVVADETQRYTKLRALVAEFLYMQARQRAHINELRAEVARLHHKVLIARRKDATMQAIHLETERERAKEALSRAEQEQQHLQDAAQEASEVLREVGGRLSELRQESASATRTERLHRLDGAMTQLNQPVHSRLEQARLQMERLRAERQINAELNGRYFPVGR